jgi:hypothetical protein
MSNTPKVQQNFYGAIGGVAGNVEADMIITQDQSTTEQKIEVLLTDYTQFIDQLQQKYPTLSDATAASQIIEVEAKLIEAQDQKRWQNFLNLKRIWNGSKKAGVKVGEHFAENNVWAKGAIAFLEGVSEDVK